MPYIREAWYVAAFAEEISSKPISRTLLDQPVVLYRTAKGDVVALGDVCPHRRAPLHLGQVHGDAIACPYHGLRFAPNGACIHNPNFNNPVPAVRTASYPAVEQDEMIWVWMGEGPGDPGTITSFAAVAFSETIRPVHGYLHIKAAESLISANLLDLSHAEFLHPYLANDGFNTRLRQNFKQDGVSVLSLYAIDDEPLTPILAQLWEGSTIDRADMHFEMRWNPPSCLLLEIGATAPGADRAEGVRAWGSHLLTPETETSTHYFWAFARHTHMQDEVFDEQLREGIAGAFLNEDAPIIEWQQRYAVIPNPVPVHPQLLPGDAGGARAQRIVDRIVKHEHAQRIGQ